MSRASSPTLSLFTTNVKLSSGSCITQRKTNISQPGQQQRGGFHYESRIFPNALQLDHEREALLWLL